MPKNARFWVYYKDSPVKLRLRPGQSIELVEGGPTDEGFHWSWESYLHDGTGVSMEWETRARDCDGRLDRSGESFTHLTDLSAGNEMDGITYPLWQKGNSQQRDYAAEAMGY